MHTSNLHRNTEYKKGFIGYNTIISYDVHPFPPWFLSLSCLRQGLAVMDVPYSPYRVPIADCMDAFHLN